VVGIGETGLDYFRLNGRTVDEMAWQRERFRVHIRAARQTGLPLVIHTRNASADTLDVLRDEGQGAVRGVFHCFTETMDVARAAVELGFHVSFSGILTFKNAQALRDVARWVPLDRCLIETDSPYLAPTPHRGKTNQPAWVAHVAGQLAAIKGLDVAHIAQATTSNFETLFGVPPAPIHRES
jgi:TatD DNase family protein